MSEDKVNLFIYGSLRDQRIFQTVSGLSFTRKENRVDDETLFADVALLPGHRRVSPDNVYFYAVTAPSSRSIRQRDWLKPRRTLFLTTQWKSISVTGFT